MPASVSNCSPLRARRCLLSHGLIAARAAIAILLLIGGGCSSRDPSNPFDPDNPETDGTPDLLRAFALDNQVELRWDPGRLEDAEAVRLTRGSGGAPDEMEVLVEQTGAGAGVFLDQPVPNDSTYSYSLQVLAPGQEWIETEPDLATPGASEPWIGDATGGGLLRLTPDGRDLRFRVETGRDLLDLQIDSNGEVWAADYANGQILRFSRDGEIRTAWDYSGSNTIAIDPLSAEIWIGSFDQQQVVRFDRAGTTRFRFENAGLVEDLSPGFFPEGGIWLAARFSGVTRIVRDQVETRWQEFEWPVAISPDPEGWVWVIDRQRRSAARILADDRVVWSDAVMNDPKDGCLDGEGGFWIADSCRGGLIHLDPEGHESEFLAVGAVDSVTLDPRRGLLWLVYREQSRIAVIDRTGRELARADVTGRPVKVEGFWRE